jgi:hypothetical protein
MTDLKVWCYLGNEDRSIGKCFEEGCGGGGHFMAQCIGALPSSGRFDASPPPWCSCSCGCHLGGCGRPSSYEVTPVLGDNLTASIWSCDQCVFQC